MLTALNEADSGEKAFSMDLANVKNMIVALGTDSAINASKNLRNTVKALEGISRWLDSDDVNGSMMNGCLMLNGYTEDSLKTVTMSEKLAVKKELKNRIKKPVERAFAWYFAAWAERACFNDAKVEQLKKSQCEAACKKLKDEVLHDSAYQHFAQIVGGQNAMQKYGCFVKNDVVGDFIATAVDLRTDIFKSSSNDRADEVNATEIASGILSKWIDNVSDADKKEAEKSKASSIRAIDSLVSNKILNGLRSSDEKKRSSAEREFLAKFMTFRSEYGRLVVNPSCDVSIKNEIKQKAMDLAKAYGSGEEASFWENLDKLTVTPLGTDKFNELFENIIKQIYSFHAPTEPKGNKGEKSEDTVSVSAMRARLAKDYMNGKLSAREFARADAALKNSLPLYELEDDLDEEEQ